MITPTIKFRQIACDITSHCNQRCNFCFNYWGKPASMGKQFFLKLMATAPAYVSEWLLISCLYEPTLHRNISEFLENIPATYRNRLFLTTNIARRLSDEFFDRLSTANINHVNISLETLNKDKYVMITKNKSSHFYDNILRCASVLKKSSSGPRLHIITMISRDNFNELVAIAKYAHEELGAARHEFRTPFFSREMPKEWLLTHTLTRTELEILKNDMHALGYSNISMDLSRDVDYYARAIYQHDYSTPRQTVPVWQPDPGENPVVSFMGAGKMLPRISAEGYFTMDELPYAWNMHKISDWNQF